MEAVQISPLTFCGQAVAAAAQLWNTSAWEITSRRRNQYVVQPRQAAIYAVREVRKLSYPAIGKQFQLDHTTCMHAVKATARRASRDPDFAERVGKLIVEVSLIAAEVDRRLKEGCMEYARKLPERITTAQVCHLAACCESELRRRVIDNAMPGPVARRVGWMYDRDEVLRALGMLDDATEGKVGL